MLEMLIIMVVVVIFFSLSAIADKIFDKHWKGGKQ